MPIQSLMLRLFRLCFWIYIPLCGLLSGGSFCQNLPDFPEKGNFYQDIFLPGEYGANEQNWAIVQDQRGIIYVGNNDGILTYDGINWQLIRTEENNTVLSLDVDANGRVYVGLESDFGYLRRNNRGQPRYTSLSTMISDTLPEWNKKVVDIWKVHVIGETVYFFSIRTIYVYSIKNNSLEAIPIRASSLSTVVNDTMYYGQWNAGIHRLAGSQPELLPGSEDYARIENFIILSHEARRQLLLVNREEGLQIYQQGRFVPYQTEADAFLKSNFVYSGTSLPDGRLILGTIRGGALILAPDGRVLNRINKETGLPGQTIVDPFIDQSNNLWIAQLSGIARVEISTPLSRFNRSSGIESTVLSMIHHRGEFYVGTLRGLKYLDNATATNASQPLSQFKGISGISSFVWDLFSDGETLLAGTDKGVYRVNNHKAVLMQGRWPRVHDFHPSLTRKDRLYIATQTGLGVLDKRRGKWHYSGKIPEMAEETIHLTVAGGDTVWMGTNARGVIRLVVLDPEPAVRDTFSAVISNFSKANGLPSGEIRPYFIENKLHFTTPKGLYRFDSVAETFRPDSTFGAMFADTTLAINGLFQAGNGDIWLHGRYHRSGDETERLVGYLRPGEAGRYRWHQGPWQRAAGLGTVKAIYPHYNAGDSLQALWLGGSEEIVRYNPAIRKNTTSDFRVLIRGVYQRNEPVAFTGGIGKAENLTAPEFDYRDNALRFEYAATFYEAARATRYQYLLDGFDESWSDWSSETRKDYTNIPEGGYQFRVRAKNVYGHPGAEAVFHFSINPPWYRSWAAYLAYLLLALGMFIVFGNYQVRRSERRAREKLEKERKEAELRETTLRLQAAEAQKEVEKEQMRSRIASDLHDEIGSNLSSISLISQMLQKKEVIGDKERQRLGNIYQVAQQTAQSMRDIVWFVNPVNDNIDQLWIKMRETANFMLDHIDFSFDAPEQTLNFETDINFRRNLYLIYKEALQNIVKHSQATFVEISIRQDENFIMQITDNGRGFDQTGKFSGNGLDNYQARAAALQGKLDITSKPGDGTELLLII